MLLLPMDGTDQAYSTQCFMIVMCVVSVLWSRKGWDARASSHGPLERSKHHTRNSYRSDSDCTASLVKHENAYGCLADIDI